VKIHNLIHNFCGYLFGQASTQARCASAPARRAGVSTKLAAARRFG